MIATSLLAIALTAGASPLAGDWETDCAAENQAGQQFYTIHHLTFTDTGFSYTIDEYQRSSCSGPSAHYAGSGTYTLPPGFGGAAIDFNYGPSTMTPSSGLAAVAMNSDAVCGLTDWQGGTATDVSGLTCNGQQIPKDGDVVPDAFTLTDDTVVFNDGLLYQKQ